MARTKSKALLYQKTAVGALVAVIAVLLIYLSTLVVTEVPINGYEEGVHYFAVENPRRIRGDHIEVMEFFSYGCSHCFNLETELQGWKKDLADDVTFIRSPALFNETYRAFAQSYYATQLLKITEENHLAFFDEIQRKKNSLTQPDKLADYYDGKGTTAALYLSAFEAPATRRQVELADQRQRRYGLSSVPSILVNGKYMVKTSSNVGLGRMLDVVDYLVEQEREARTSSPTE